jgi:dCTP deaminase
VILTDREIQVAIENGQIEITPKPDAGAYSSTSLDLTLSDPAELWNSSPGQPIRPGAKGYNYDQLIIRKTKIQSLHNYTLIPGAFVLAWTAETVHLPVTSRFAARVEGKSALARLGLVVHLTAPTIHAGYKGQIQLEMINFGPNEIILDVGMPICQLIFEATLGTPAKGYFGQFFGADTALTKTCPATPIGQKFLKLSHYPAAHSLADGA